MLPPIEIPAEYDADNNDNDERQHPQIFIEQPPQDDIKLPLILQQIEFPIARTANTVEEIEESNQLLESHQLLIEAARQRVEALGWIDNICGLTDEEIEEYEELIEALLFLDALIKAIETTHVEMSEATFNSLLEELYEIGWCW